MSLKPTRDIQHKERTYKSKTKHLMTGNKNIYMEMKYTTYARLSNIQNKLFNRNHNNASVIQFAAFKYIFFLLLHNLYGEPLHTQHPIQLHAVNQNLTGIDKNGKKHIGDIFCISSVQLSCYDFIKQILLKLLISTSHLSLYIEIQHL